MVLLDSEKPSAKILRKLPSKLLAIFRKNKRFLKNLHLAKILSANRQTRLLATKITILKSIMATVERSVNTLAKLIPAPTKLGTKMTLTIAISWRGQ